MTSYVSLLVCMISGAGVPQKCRLQKLVKKSRFVQIAKQYWKDNLSQSSASISLQKFLLI